MHEQSTLPMPAPSTEDVERWRPVPGFPDYAVSDHGRVRRERPGPSTWPGRMMNPGIVGKGYKVGRGYAQVVLNGKPRRVHRLVWLAFRGAVPRGVHVHHIDGSTTNNRLDNLEIIEAGAHTVLHFRKHPVGKCAVCGASTSRVKSCANRSSWRGTRTCSEECGRAYKEMRRKHPAERACAVCGKTYPTGKHAAQSRTCSNECRAINMERKVYGKRRKHPVTRPCCICGEAFDGGRARGRRTTCGPACAIERKRQIGRENAKHLRGER